MLSMNRHLIFAAVLLLAACTTETSVDTDDMPNSSSSAPAIMEASSSSEQAQARVIEITASNWAFAPSAISVKKGEKVVVRLRGASGIHGFAIRGTNVSVTVNPEEVVDIVLPTDTEGSFEFFCNVPCGEGHNDMRGTLTVTA